MTLLNFIFTVIGILFIVWLYALIYADNLPIIHLNQLQEKWKKLKDYPISNVLNKIYQTIVEILRFIGRIIFKIFKFILEVLAEIIFNILLRGIWFLIKAFFSLILRIFDA